jgi:formylglycine-generating enzyme required for sulfatase activity
MTVAPFAIDKYPITNQQYKQYMDRSGYRPVDGHNFLRRWTSNAKTDRSIFGYARAPREADLEKPVTHVSLKEARAYCAHYGKRLPHEVTCLCFAFALLCTNTARSTYII